MSLHHYLPAAYLGRFSKASTLPRRQRIVAVGDLKEKRCFLTSAAKVAAQHGLYTLLTQPEDPNLIDRIWSEYEDNLGKAIDQLIEGTVDAITWAGVLVPFVTALVVRGPDFNKRFAERLGGLNIDLPPDNINYARTVELQRLLAPVLAAKWIVLATHGDGSLITDDIGFAGFVNRKTGDMGLSVPLGPRHVLVIIPKRCRAIVAAKSGQWYPIIQYSTLKPGNHLKLNTTLVRAAQRFIFGPDKETVVQFMKQDHEPGKVPEPYELGFISGTLAMVHEFT